MGDNECPEGEHRNDEGECVAMEKSDNPEFVTKSDFDAFKTEVLDALKGLRKEDDDEDKDKDKDEDMEKSTDILRLEEKLDKFLASDIPNPAVKSLEKKLDEAIKLRKAEGADAPGAGSGAADTRPDVLKDMAQKWKDAGFGGA
ncbi:MAG: hypothetical protein LN413_00665 [Candidatus Thermoplasmatota archaeon]|nr:hypothetical protein [Candidatus Thermoplasmatota archaeon]